MYMRIRDNTLHILIRMHANFRCTTASDETIISTQKIQKRTTNLKYENKTTTNQWQLLIPQLLQIDDNKGTYSSHIDKNAHQFLLYYYNK